MYQKSKLCNTVVDEVRKYFSTQVFKTVIPRNIDIAAAPSEGAPITVLKKPTRSNKGSQQYWAMAKELHQRVNFIRNKYGISEPNRLQQHKLKTG